MSLLLTLNKFHTLCFFVKFEQANVYIPKHLAILLVDLEFTSFCLYLFSKTSRSNWILENYKFYFQKTYAKTLIQSITNIIKYKNAFCFLFREEFIICRDCKLTVHGFSFSINHRSSKMFHFAMIGSVAIMIFKSIWNWNMQKANL